MNPKPRKLLATWWNDPPNDWLLDFLESHGALPKVRSWIAVGTLGLTAVLASVICSPAGPHHHLAKALAAVIVFFGFCRMLWWLFGPWPSARQSIWSIAVADLTIAITCWLDSDHLVGLAVTSAFLMPGAFLTFFHSARAVAAHVGLVSVTIVTLAVAAGTEADHGGPVVAAALAILNLTVAVGILPMLRIGFEVIRQGAADALIDPLTGLANRRGLDQLLNRRPQQAQRGMMCVFAIDLDHFKSINDRYGHLVGDDVLARTAARIQSAVGPDAVVARIGGEEFVAVHLLQPAAVQPMAERIRIAIADTTEPQVTASIGVAITTAQTLPDSHGIAQALKCADTVMYAAKRQGGNAVNLHPCAAYTQVVQRSGVQASA